jgi:hypothetical protein
LPYVKTGKKTGRPKAEIDKKTFEGLCALQCTRNEVCEFFHVTDKTLDRWCKEQYEKSFSAVFAIKRGVGKVSLRRSGFELARTSAAMNIFLQKNYCGLRDQPVEESETDRPKSVQITIQIHDQSKPSKNGSGCETIVDAK